MPLAFGADIKEGKVYRSKRKQEGDDEKQALRELNTILNQKNRKACDCEAQTHELLENCLSCGRLACVVEGPGRCFACGNVVMSGEQRDKLSKFIDVVQMAPGAKPSTATTTKTRIIDNQYDHFSVDNKKHLREEDRRKLRGDLEELQSKRYQRKLMLEVDIDNLEAGSRSLAQIDDYEAELRRLQLNDGGAQNEKPTLNLCDLVSKEAKTNYLFEYVTNNDHKHERRKKTASKNVGDGVKVKVK